MAILSSHHERDSLKLVIQDGDYILEYWNCLKSNMNVIDTNIAIVEMSSNFGARA